MKRPRKAAAPRPEPLPRSDWVRRFVLGVAAWLVPAAIAWIVLAPYYNRFLTTAAENLVRVVESPNVTRLTVHDRHHLVIQRSDTSRPGKPWLGSIRTSDTHFPLIMLVAFFLAVPGIRWRRRLENLGWALLIAVFFHIVSLFFRVHFVYATQLGEFSAEHYGPLARNLWGISSHLLELPFKFALPFLLWAAFYIRRILPS